MIIAVIFWAYLTFITLAYGAGILKWLQKLLQLQNDAFLPLPVIAISGLAGIAWLSSVLSLFLKTGWFAHLLILAGGLFFAQFGWEEIKASFQDEFGKKYWMHWTLILLGGIATVLYAVKIPSNLDTPLYHGQAIRWIEEFPVVPGLANLDPRLGSNSNWFVLDAAFSFAFLKLQSFHLVPSFLFLVCLFYFWSGFPTMLRGDLHLSQMI